MLKNIKLNKKEYTKLLSDYFDYGTEAFIIKENDIVIKLFKLNLFKEDALDNKLKKIELLASMPDLDNKIYPLHTYSLNGKFVGYAMPYIQDSNLTNKHLYEQEKIVVLREINKKLKHFHEHGIIYGDIKKSNIKLGSEITFMDLDNMKIGDYDIDIHSNFSYNFINSYGKVDSRLDAYMLNLLTIDMFSYHIFSYYTVINEIESLVLPNIINNQRNRILALKLAKPNHLYDGELFIDNV